MSRHSGRYPTFIRGGNEFVDSTLGCTQDAEICIEFSGNCQFVTWSGISSIGTIPYFQSENLPAFQLAISPELLWGKQRMWTSVRDSKSRQPRDLDKSRHVN